MSTVSEYGARNREQLARLQRLVAEISDDDLLRRDPHGDWTVADTLAHLAFFDRRAQILMEKFAREGVTPSPYDAQTINDALLPLVRRIPPRAVAEEAVAAAIAADAAAAALTDAQVAAIRARNEVKPERDEHRRNHLDDIEAILSAG